MKPYMHMRDSWELSSFRSCTVCKLVTPETGNKIPGGTGYLYRNPRHVNCTAFLIPVEYWPTTLAS